MSQRVPTPRQAPPRKAGEAGEGHPTAALSFNSSSVSSRASRTAVNHVWGERNNFFYYLGSLPIILLFVLLFTGLFLFIYYNMSASSSYESVKYMTEQTLLAIRN